MTRSQSSSRSSSEPSRNANRVEASAAGERPQLSTREAEDIEERSSPRTPIIYEVVRRLGE